jgi:hypothetical protein
MSVVVLLHDAPNTRNLLNVCQIYHLIYTFTFIPQLVTFNTNLLKYSYYDIFGYILVHAKE